MSLECSEIFGLISEYVDGELPEDTCTRIGAHLDSCVSCRGLYESLQRTVEACREFRAGQAPGPMTIEVQEQLRAAFRKAVAARKDADSTRR